MSEKNIDSHLKENRTFEPSEAFKGQAKIGSEAEYLKLYQESIENPEAFWGEQAKKNLHWFKEWDSVVSSDFSSVGEKEAPYVEWFKGGKINASYNCLDRHIEAGNGDKLALIWQGENAEEERKVSYKELHQEVCKFANVLKSKGAKKGTVVTIFMPMIPEAAVALLACARIGAIHSVVFSAFSPESLKSRINDCASEVVVTSDVSYHAGKTLNLKEKVDQAVADCPSVKTVMVFDRGNTSPEMKEGRDFWWKEETEKVSADCEPEHLDAEDPLFILYTSGSTGKPKGVLHTNAGYQLYAHLTFKYVFDIKDTDIFWCTADVGWITGHSYFVYGPMSNGATQVMFEGVPTYPTPDRFWSITDQYKVSLFYTAPTAIRALMRLGEEWPEKYDLSSLRLLGTVGEPINPEAWIWYNEVIGKGKCPIVDTWWQTETGGIMITTLPGALATKPGSAGKPFFGVEPAILRNDGTQADVNEGGCLTITKPWPGMLRGTYGDKKNELIKKVYFSMFPGKYFAGDGCRIDEDGYYWLLGRIDDVINVSAHRFATAEIESALVSNEHVAESAVVGFPHDTKGQGIYCFVTLNSDTDPSDELRKTLVQHVRTEISPIATPDKIHFTPSLPKTRSGKIMRRVLRKIAENKVDEIGDTSTLADPSVVQSLLDSRV